MNSTTSATNPAHGIALLAEHEKCQYFATTEHCWEHIVPHSTHPFGLSVPEKEPGMGEWRIHFVGVHATDMSVEAFIAHVRELAGYADGCKITKLRVINTPADRPGQNYVFFEIWSTGRVIISGAMTDFSGAGDEGRRSLEDVFAVLAYAYRLEIERVQATPLRSLYTAKVS